MTAQPAPQPAASPLTADEIAAVRQPYRAASLLPGRAYHDPAIHDFERQEWFRREWMVVGREEDAPSAGTYFTAEVDDEPLLIARGRDGELRAFFNVCRHRGTAVVEEQEADYIGKAALEEIRRKGVDRKLVGIEVDGDALPFELSRKCDALSEGKAVGTVTDLIWSPRLEKNIGYVWLPIALAGPGTELEIVAPNGELWPATSAAIPFLDTKKQVPLGK